MSIYDTLNEQQKKGVLSTDGPVLLLAGAGSGKTRVLVHRIAYLIDELGVEPWNILAITFTNKAAGEMRERVNKIVGFGAEQVWVSTFHSMCVRILRRFADKIGYDTNFVIYDTDDTKSIIKEIMKRFDVDTRYLKDKTIRAAISSSKDELIDPVTFEKNAQYDRNELKIASIYKEYQAVLRKNNAMDFDDLIMKTVELFQTHPEVLASYQERFHYIHVDEYQDTNTAQFELVRLLANKRRNLCVVGDDDQSIYKFRGANIRNILDFEDNYPDATVIKLEENYRSTQNILNAANSVIHNNAKRKDKTLWTKKTQGNLVHFAQFDSAPEEAEYIISDIRSKHRQSGLSYADCAILYRTNAQSRLLEERCIHAGVPYQVVGGVNFYSRREIKDILAYLKTIDNGKDELAVKRIINIPKRGIGATTIAKVSDFAMEHNITFFSALEIAREIPTVGKAAEKIKGFTDLIHLLRNRLEEYSLVDLMDDVLSKTGYIKLLEEEGDEESLERIGNIEELVTKVNSFTDEHDEATLSDFLSEVALVSDIDNTDDESEKLLLMTLHAAKGLEFSHVYIAGMEDGIFPSMQSIYSDERDALEEERRLAYVGMTRAMDELTLTAAKSRMQNGEMQYNAVSRFVKEIPKEYLDGSVFTPRRHVEEDLPSPRPKAFLSPDGPSKKKPFVATSIQQLNKVSGIAKGGSMEVVKPDYAVGDRVRHIKFGEGTVLSMEKEPRDYKVKVEFDEAGVKIMYSTFARLTKVML